VIFRRVWRRILAEVGTRVELNKGVIAMEHFRNPFAPRDTVRGQVSTNREFFDALLERAKHHRFFSHPILSTLGDTPQPPEIASFILTSMYKVVAPFTGALSTLGGRAPDLRSRFALMDNLYEEMGRGEIEAAHPMLYLQMLASIGINERAVDRQSTLPSIQRINEHLLAVVEEQPFPVACAVLAAAEAAIPPLFPVLAAMARTAFDEIDMSFFERHGGRDVGHCEDASMLFAVSADASHFAMAERAFMLDLDHRAEMLDEWMSAIASGTRPRTSDRPPRSVRPAAQRSSAPPF
jgi:pyrroloquinoline quinone (PQQ) biosynthesis protein C